ncbi:MAG: transporter substrate-binding domain-containing protein [Proteobacteria bacterium]|nr:transporter substrate-binding domain-containing protein [Pseudomonadota bacterium]
MIMFNQQFGMINKRRMAIFFLVIIILPFLSYVSHAKDVSSEDKIDIELTENEIAWIREHKTIRIGVDPGFAPFEFLSEKRVYEGLAADYVNLLGRSLSLNFEPVLGISWKEAVNLASQGEIDMLPCVGMTKEREAFLAYSEFYLEFPRVIIVQIGADILPLEDLKHKRVGVQARSSHDGFVKEKTGFMPVPFETFQDALQSLSRGELDAVIGNMAVATFNIRKYNLTNLKIAAFATKKLSSLAFGVRKDWPVLVGLINKFLDALPEEKKIEISQKWMPDQALRALSSDSAGTVSLTEEEQLFLQDHSEIRVGIDPSYPPFEWLDKTDGRHMGISSDYLRLLEDRLGVTLKVVNVPTWSLVLDGVRSHLMDVVACISETPSRKQFLQFTQPYLSFPVVIITRTRMPFISSLKDLNGKKVSIVKDYAPYEVISRDFPELKVSLCNSPIEGLKTVSLGGTDAYIGNLAVCVYLMQNHNIANLKVAAPAEGIASSDLAMGVRSDWPMLATILNKALQSITPEEQNMIVKKWISVRFEHAADWGRVIKVVSIFIAVALIIFGFFLYWNRKLTKEITFRRQIETEREAAKNKAEKALENLKTAQQQLIQSEKMAALGILVAGIVHEINNPVNFIKTSIIGLEQDIRDLERLLKIFEHCETGCKDSDFGIQIREVKKDIDYPILVKEVPELVSSIFEGVRRTEDIIGSLRIYSRMDEAVTDQKDIHELIKASLQILRSRYKKEIELKEAYAAVPLIFLNSGKIIQVFVNILSNAIDAIKGKDLAGKGTILIKTGVRSIDGREYVWVDIADNGGGIPDTIKDKVFDPFFTTKDVGQGTGLGLSISIGIVREHGGMIQINSALNIGTTVSVFLPVNQGSEKKNEQK